ncbi:hypothetical protein J1614_010403 [Plenodomus biglobosus]|nr:hypothetical protein J1614_010403 [Plenodomus biglobosus]
MHVSRHTVLLRHGNQRTYSTHCIGCTRGAHGRDTLLLDDANLQYSSTYNVRSSYLLYLSDWPLTVTVKGPSQVACQCPPISCGGNTRGGACQDDHGHVQAPTSQNPSPTGVLVSLLCAFTTAVPHVRLRNMAMKQTPCTWTPCHGGGCIDGKLSVHSHSAARLYRTGTDHMFGRVAQTCQVRGPGLNYSTLLQYYNVVVVQYTVQPPSSSSSCTAHGLMASRLAHSTPFFD